MKYNTTSNFPVDADDLLFFTDIRIADVPFIEKYNEAIKNGNFDQANALNYTEGSDTFTYTAGLFNLIVNRIIATQNFLLNKPPITREILDSIEPINIAQGQVWITIN